MAAILLAAAAAHAALAPPPAVVASLRRMQVALEPAATCAVRHPQSRLAEAARQRDRRLSDAIAAAGALWGRASEPSRAASLTRPPACTRAAVAAQLAAFDRAERLHAAAYAAATLPMRRGLWFGALRICGAQALPAAMQDEMGLPSVAIALPPRLQRSFAALTADLVGASLALRLDGRIISSPTVNSPIRGGRVAITPADPAIAARLRDAAAAPC